MIKKFWLEAWRDIRVSIAVFKASSRCHNLSDTIKKQRAVNGMWAGRRFLMCLITDNTEQTYWATAAKQPETRREKMRPLAYLCEASSSVMSLIKTNQRARKKSSLQSLPGEQQPSVKHRTMNITQFDEYLLKYWISDSVAIIISLLWIWWWILKWTYCVIFSYFLSYLLCMCWTFIIKTDFQIMKCVCTNKYPDSDNSFYSRSFFDDAGEGISQIWSKNPTHLLCPNVYSPLGSEVSRVTKFSFFIQY